MGLECFDDHFGFHSVYKKIVNRKLTNFNAAQYTDTVNFWQNFEFGKIS